MGLCVSRSAESPTVVARRKPDAAAIRRADSLGPVPTLSSTALLTQTQAAAAHVAGTPSDRHSSRERRISWQRGDKIGQGSYGTVFVGLNLNSGAMMAVKEVRIEEDDDELAELEKEIRLMRCVCLGRDRSTSQQHSRGVARSRLNHRNIVRYLGTQRRDGALYIFTEWVPGGSISSLLLTFGTLSENVVRTYTRQLLAGLAFLHSKSVVHRDIKVRASAPPPHHLSASARRLHRGLTRPSTLLQGGNVLVDDHGVVKLADFGASKQLDTIDDSMSYTVRRRAPPPAQRPAPL